MYTVLISVFLGLTLTTSFGFSGAANWGWSVFWGVLLFAACQAGVGLILKKRISSMMLSLQGTLTTGQKQLQEKVNSWRFHSPGSPKQAQLEMSKLMHQYIEKALEQSLDFEKYYKWSPLLKKQINTFRMQMHYQDKNFKEVDRLMPSCIFIEPISMSMRLARMYVNNDPKIDDVFEKSVRKLRYGQGAIIYCLYAWIAVRHDNIDLALTILNRAAKKMENETVKRNIEILRNNKPKQFNLAGLGDEWYALGLEEPRVKYQRAPQRPF